jgi:protein NrfD
VVERRQLERDQQAASLILFLFLSHLGVGIAFTLAFVSREAGVKFFRFNFGLAAILIAIALAVRYPGLNSSPLPAEGGAALARAGLVALVVSEAAILLYWATVGRTLARIRPAIMTVAVGCGLIALVLQALAVSAGDTVPIAVLTVASFLSSAALLGGTCTAMILGHWYLVIPSLEVRHLQSIVKLHMGSMVVRIAVVGAAVFAGLALGEAGPAAGVGNFGRYIFSLDGIFFWQRVLFGLAGPAVLSYLTWETAKIRSTQSATGILYVDFFTVVVGEVLAKYLVLATRVPL